MNKDGSQTIVLTRDQLRDILTVAAVTDDGLIRLIVKDDFVSGPNNQEVALRAIISGQVLDGRTIVEDASTLQHAESWQAHRLDRPIRLLRNSALDEYARRAPATHDPARDHV